MNRIADNAASAHNTRYIHRVIVTSVKPAPYKMQNRIWKVGMRPINALVDITNYVMLATGNPTHAFDADNITDHIVVRHAGEGEKLLLLNDKELELNADDLVITVFFLLFSQRDMVFYFKTVDTHRTEDVSYNRCVMCVCVQFVFKPVHN